MELKRFQIQDSAIICSWIQDEKSLYQWSAARFGKFPLAENDLNEDYVPKMKDGRFIPLNLLLSIPHSEGAEMERKCCDSQSTMPGTSWGHRRLHWGYLPIMTVQGIVMRQLDFGRLERLNCIKCRSGIGNV